MALSWKVETALKIDLPFLPSANVERFNHRPGLPATSGKRAKKNLKTFRP
jgi:hypothetical protein